MSVWLCSIFFSTWKCHCRFKQSTTLLSHFHFNYRSIAANCNITFLYNDHSVVKPIQKLYLIVLMWISFNWASTTLTLVVELNKKKKTGIYFKNGNSPLRLKNRSNSNRWLLLLFLYYPQWIKLGFILHTFFAKRAFQVERQSELKCVIAVANSQRFLIAPIF